MAPPLFTHTDPSIRATVRVSRALAAENRHSTYAIELPRYEQFLEEERAKDREYFRGSADDDTLFDFPDDAELLASFGYDRITAIGQSFSTESLGDFHTSAPFQELASLANLSTSMPSTNSSIPTVQSTQDPSQHTSPAPNVGAESSSGPSKTSQSEPEPQLWVGDIYFDHKIFEVAQVVLDQLAPPGSVTDSGVMVKMKSTESGIVQNVEINRVKQQGAKIGIFRCPVRSCSERFVRRFAVERHFGHAHPELTISGMKWSDHPTCRTYRYGRKNPKYSRRTKSETDQEKADNGGKLLGKRKRAVVADNEEEENGQPSKFARVGTDDQKQRQQQQQVTGIRSAVREMVGHVASPLGPAPITLAATLPGTAHQNQSNVRPTVFTSEAEYVAKQDRQAKRIEYLRREKYLAEQRIKQLERELGPAVDEYEDEERRWEEQQRWEHENRHNQPTPQDDQQYGYVPPVQEVMSYPDPGSHYMGNQEHNWAGLHSV